MNISKGWATALALGLLPLQATATDNCNPVGTWAVDVDFPAETGIPQFHELISFLPGGVVLESNTQLHANSANALLPYNGSTGHGTWVRLSNCRIKFTVLKQVFDPSQSFLGFIRITARARISGNAYSIQLVDSNVELVFDPDPDAPPVMSFGGSASHGKRVKVGQIPPPPPTIEITTPTLPDGTVGVSYSAVIASAVPPGTENMNTWQIIAGELPPGLAIAPSTTPTTTLSGTPTVSGAFIFILQLFNSLGTDEQTFSVTIH